MEDEADPDADIWSTARLTSTIKFSLNIDPARTPRLNSTLDFLSLSLSRLSRSLLLLVGILSNSIFSVLKTYGIWVCCAFYIAFSLERPTVLGEKRSERDASAEGRS